MMDTARYRYWHKGSPEVQLTPSFTSTEFTCPCLNADCKLQRVSIELVDTLQLIRNQLNKPIRVTSGFRCFEHQHELRERGHETAKLFSQHELGNAADIKPIGADLTSLLFLCDKEFDAIGIGRTFIHVDVRRDKKRRWMYK